MFLRFSKNLEENASKFINLCMHTLNCYDVHEVHDALTINSTSETLNLQITLKIVFLDATVIRW